VERGLREPGSCANASLNRFDHTAILLGRPQPRTIHDIQHHTMLDPARRESRSYTTTPQNSPAVISNAVSGVLALLLVSA
jgi:hypothetical protein